MSNFFKRPVRKGVGEKRQGFPVGVTDPLIGGEDKRAEALLGAARLKASRDAGYVSTLVKHVEAAVRAI